jgi:hypothetical protein
MFPMRPEDSPEPDVIGTPGADGFRPRWRRYVVAGGVLAVAAIITVASLSLPRQHSAAHRPGRVTASLPAPAPPAPSAPDAMPSEAWVTSLGIANWPMPGSTGGLYRGMFAGGVAGKGGWDLTVRAVTRPGQGCVAVVVLELDGPTVDPVAVAYPLPSRPASRTPAGNMAFIALGAQSPGVGVGFIQLDAPAAQAWAEPDRIGGLEVSVPVLTMPACGQRYYLAGFAYPLAGTLDVFVARNGARPVHYLVPTRLSRPRVPRVWQSTG